MAPEKDIEKAVPAKAAGADKKPCLDRVLSSKHGVKIIAVGSCLVIAGAIIGVLYATCVLGCGGGGGGGGGTADEGYRLRF